MTLPTAAPTEPPAPRWRRIYVGVLTRIAPHPHADREVVVEGDAGWVRLTVVTGGPAVEVGRKVAVALPGGRAPDPQAEEGADQGGAVGGDALLGQGAGAFGESLPGPRTAAGGTDRRASGRVARGGAGRQRRGHRRSPASSRQDPSRVPTRCTTHVRPPTGPMAAY